GSSSLQIASLHGFEQMVVLLLEHGADVAATTSISGWTSLHVAAHRGHEAVVQVLLRHGADLLSKNTAGRTAEELATDGHQHEIATMLKE
ncbi:ankyrin repeat protein, partial [Baffinella frigidus]